MSGIFEQELKTGNKSGNSINDSIGIVLCKDANRAFVDYVVRDFDKPMRVATYKMTQDMPQKLRDALPPIEGLKALLEEIG